jgi:hypothetical protein
MWIEVVCVRAGGEIEVELRARGWRYRFPGNVSLEDAMRAVNGHMSLNELASGYSATGGPGGAVAGPSGALDGTDRSAS